MKKVHVVILLTMLLCWGIGTLFYAHVVIQDVQRLKADVLVQTEVIGLNSDTDALHFGSLKTAGGIGRRRVDISSERDAWVSIRAAGNITPYLDVSNKSFFLKKDQPEQIEFKATIPPNTTPGNYTGKVIFIFRQPWTRHLEMFK